MKKETENNLTFSERFQFLSLNHALEELINVYPYEMISLTKALENSNHLKKSSKEIKDALIENLKKDNWKKTRMTGNIIISLYEVTEHGHEELIKTENFKGVIEDYTSEFFKNGIAILFENGNTKEDFLNEIKRFRAFYEFGVLNLAVLVIDSSQKGAQRLITDLKELNGSGLKRDIFFPVMVILIN